MRLSNPFVISNTPEQHDIETEDGILKVWIKPLSWIEQQEALTQFVEFSMDGDDVQPNLDFAGYWNYVLHRCVVKTEPKCSKADLNNLKPEVGKKLSAVLPDLTEMMAAIGGESTAPLE